KKSRGRWDEYDGAHPEVKRLGPLVYVSAHAGHGCADFEASLWGVWELVGERLVLRTNPDRYDYAVPVAGVDLDGDGRIELLLEDGVLRIEGDRYGAPDRLQVPDHDSPC